MKGILSCYASVSESQFSSCYANILILLFNSHIQYGKWPECKAERSSWSDAEVSNVYSFTSISCVHVPATVPEKRNGFTFLKYLQVHSQNHA